VKAAGCWLAAWSGAVTATLVALPVALFADQARDRQADDRAVYEAIVQSPLWPASFARPIGVPLLTKPVCATAADTRCLPPRHVEPVGGAKPSARWSRSLESVPLAVRQELTQSFLERNGTSVTVPEILRVTRLDPPAFLRRPAPSSIGSYGVLTAPGYAGDYALVAIEHSGSEAPYRQGWLYVLQRHPEGWRVLSTLMLWIS
jgi:hypothetical protein